MIFHAGTTRKGDALFTSGGRVLAVTSLGDTLSEALKQSNETAAKISYAGKYFRSDIGLDLV
jgi:phosphoribosylamine--glycine ligase